MNVQISPTTLSGTIAAISSKSDAHRHLICAALSENPAAVICRDSSEDIDATINCLRELGANIEKSGGKLIFKPGTPDVRKAALDCAESGSTLRFLLPVAAALCENVHLSGRGRLSARPIDDLVAVMRQNGVSLSSDHLPLDMRGKLQSGRYALPGNVSSQYITGLLFALPLLNGDSEIVLSTRLESAAYVDITLRTLSKYGISVEPGNGGFLIPGNQRYRAPGDVTVEGDWSNAAFFLAAGAIGAPLTVSGLAMDSPQGDRAITEFLRQFGADVTVGSDSVSVVPKSLRGCDIDIGETPDLLPALAVVASKAEGESRFLNGARLRLKESDRLKSTVSLIRSLGGQAQECEDGITVCGGSLRGGIADSFHDHRIVMAAAIAAIACTGPVTILDAGAAAKSYPGFFNDYQKLGGKVDIILEDEDRGYH